MFTIVEIAVSGNVGQRAQIKFEVSKSRLWRDQHDLLAAHALAEQSLSFRDKTVVEISSLRYLFFQATFPLWASIINNLFECEHRSDYFRKFSVNAASIAGTLASGAKFNTTSSMVKPGS